MNNNKLSFILVVLAVSIVLNGTLTIYLFGQNNQKGLTPIPTLEDMERVTKEACSQYILGSDNLQENQWSFTLKDMEQVAQEARVEAAQVAADPKKAIAQMIIERKFVKEEYFTYIEEEELRQKIEQYNNNISQLRPQLEFRVISELEHCFNMDIDVKNYKNLPPEVTYIIKKVAQYSMYTNRVQLIYNDPELAQMMAMEPAKFNEEWQNFMNSENIVDELKWLNMTLKAYCQLIDEIVSTLYDGRQDIVEKVLARQIVEDTYFTYVKDAQLLDKIKEYNKLTADTKFEYVGKMIWYTQLTIDYKSNGAFNTDQTQKKVDNLNYFDRGVEQKTFVPRTSHYTLYRNATWLIYSDPIISPMLVQNSGNTVSEWPERYRNTMTKLYNYNDFVDEVVNKFK